MRPVIIFIVLDFPEPLGPRYPVISPALAMKLTPSTARAPRNRFVTFRNSSIPLVSNLQSRKSGLHGAATVRERVAVTPRQPLPYGRGSVVVVSYIGV